MTVRRYGGFSDRHQDSCGHRGMSRAGRLVLGIVLGALGSALLPVPAVAAAPVVGSESVSHIAPTDATLEAQINRGGLETSYRFHLAYGCDLSGNEVCPMYCIAGEPCPGPQNGPVDIPLPSGVVPSSSEIEDVSLDLNAAGVTLKPGTKYRYSVEATNTAGTTQGQNQFFTTPSGTPSPPSVESESVSGITSRRSTLEAQVNPGGAQTTYEFWLEYANCQNTPPGNAACMSISVEKAGEGTITAGSSGQRISATVTYLQPSYSYTYWVIATNSVGKTEGAHQSFTAAPAPVIAGESASGVTGTNAKLEAQINPEGQNVHYQLQLVNAPSEYAYELECPEPSSTICVGTHVQGALPIGLVWGNLENPLAAQPVSLDLESAGVKLKPGTTYHYRVIAAPSVPSEDTIEWEGLPVYGPDQTFTTASAPSIESESGSHITPTDANLEAQINTQGLETTYEFHLATAPLCEATEPPCERPKYTYPLPAGKLLGSFVGQRVSIDLNSAGVNLRPGERYEYSVTATSSAGTTNGPQQTFVAGEDVFQPLSSQALPTNSGSSSQTSGGSLGQAPGSAIPKVVADPTRSRLHFTHKHHHRSKIARHRRHRGKRAGHRHSKP